MTGYRILVVEDDEPILTLMDLLLRNLGFEPVLTSNGPEALERVSREPPSLILLDIMMTPIDGWEVLARLRGELGIREIPVILFTALPAVEERMAAFGDPRLGVLHKPVSLSDLRIGIARFLPAP